MLNPQARRILDWGIGITFILIGVLSVAIPFVPGWPFFLAGLGFLSRHSRWARALQEKLRRAGRTIREKVTGRAPDS